MRSRGYSHRHEKPDQQSEPDEKPAAPSPDPVSEEDFFANWLVPSHDEKGHSDRENVRFSPSMMRAMQIIVEGGKTPYQTKSDLVRHAVHNHLLTLEGMQPRTGRHFLVGLRISQQVAQDEAYREELEKLFTQMERNIKYHLGRAEVGEATRQAGMLWQQFSHVAESPWKRQAAQRFLYQYGYLLGWRQGIEPAAVPMPDEPGEPEVLDAEIVDNKGDG